jgi:hypothetical protein
MRTAVNNRHGKKVTVDEVTGKIQLAQSLGMNTPYRDRDLLEQEMDDIRNHYSPEEIARKKELEKIREEKIRAAFNEWLAKDHVTDFKGHTPSTPNHLIIKVFYYHELNNISVSQGGILLTEGVGEFSLDSLHKVLPIGYVVASSSEDIKPGDIVNLPSLVSKTKISEEYKQWQKEVREQPTLKREEMLKPPMYVGILSQWGQYIYQRNPFSDVDIEDQHTFCLPDRMIQSVRTDLK